MNGATRVFEWSSVRREVNVLAIAVEQRERYVVAVEAVAQWLIANLETADSGAEEYLDTAFAKLRGFQASGNSEHLWIFRDPVVLLASENLFEALEERSDGGRDWFHADLASAVAAVARYDVMANLAERVAEWDDELEAEDGAMQVGEGEA
jgi:hypothetical protein